MAWKIDCNDLSVLSEGRQDRAPRAAASAEPVNQKERFAVAGARVMQCHNRSNAPERFVVQSWKLGPRPLSVFLLRKQTVRERPKADVRVILLMSAFHPNRTFGLCPLSTHRRHRVYPPEVDLGPSWPFRQFDGHSDSSRVSLLRLFCGQPPTAYGRGLRANSDYRVRRELGLISFIASHRACAKWFAEVLS